MGADLLRIYLQDHLGGSTGGLELAKRALGSNEGTEFAPPLRRLVAEIEEDRDTLEGTMRRLGFGPDRLKLLAGWGAEKAGRLKLNGSLLSYSPLSRVLELEGLVAGVTAKQQLWRVLRDRADGDPRLDAAELEGLIQRAERQRRELQELVRRAGAEAFENSSRE